MRLSYLIPLSLAAISLAACTPKADQQAERAADHAVAAADEAGGAMSTTATNAMNVTVDAAQDTAAATKLAADKAALDAKAASERAQRNASAAVRELQK